MTTFQPVDLDAVFDEHIPEDARRQHDAIYRAVGKFIIQWATVETLFIDCLRDVLGVSNANAQVLFYSLNSNRARVKLLSTLSKENLPAGIAAELAALLRAFKGATTVRNELAHGEFEMDLKTKMYVAIHSANLDDYKGGDPTKRIPLTFQWSNRLKQQSRALGQLNRDLVALRKRLIQHASTRPRP